MFLPPDMVSVREFRQEFRSSLENNGFCKDDILQVELAADEALTNAVTANVACNCEETIICRWMIDNFKLTLYIVDYGKGFRFNPEMKSNTCVDMPSSLKSYIDAIFHHQSEKAGHLPFAGVKQLHKNMGKGLHIVHTFMDTVKIMYHSEGVVSDTLEGSEIMGSIVQLNFAAKKNCS
ncbi:MAG: ATP-binding protein [Leptospiraceae bacterium]|nr:ATP-binding protein [Leptospiraceae bacterium]MCK6381063.1 ATP-binding protein [Leptospiraceae bacterium]NUM40598.1 ATP-binding protein [Leptospiraceae bacterium]